MQDKQSVKELILASKRAANEDMAQIKSANPLTYSFFDKKLRDYVMHKYHMNPETTTTIDFHELTELSMSNSMKISKELVKEFDLANSCDGTSSVMAKKVLLFRSIEKALEIQLPAMETARFKLLCELSAMAWKEMQKAAHWQDLLAD